MNYEFCRKVFGIRFTIVSQRIGKKDLAKFYQ